MTGCVGRHRPGARARNPGSIVLLPEEDLAWPIRACIRLRRSPPCSSTGWDGSTSTSRLRACGCCCCDGARARRRSCDRLTASGRAVNVTQRAHLGPVAVPAAAHQPTPRSRVAGGGRSPSPASSSIRVRGKHIFNPTNGGIVAMLLLTDQVWVSPGQWGSVAFFAFLMACVGGLVVNRASRSDVTYAFIACYCALLVRPLAVSRRAADDSAAPPRERRAAAVHLLHDFRSEDDARLAGRARAVRGARRLRRVVRAVPAVPNQRAAVVAGGVVAGGAAHRSAAAGRALRVDVTATIQPRRQLRMMKEHES